MLNVHGNRNRIGGVMASVLATKDYKIGICCFSAKHAALRTKSKDWSARNQNNVSEWVSMSIGGLLFQLLLHMVFTSHNWFVMQGPVAIILISWNVIFIWETGYWTRAIKRLNPLKERLKPRMFTVFRRRYTCIRYQ